MTSWSSFTYDEFTQEARRVDELTWEALSLPREGEVLFCGYENARALLERARAAGVKAVVVDVDADALRRAAEAGFETIRASATALPVRDDRFSLAVAHHYLHEIDPAYHASIVFELGRVARRIAVVEPGPPADLLGSRIASLYSRAKRRLGQFEQYQDIEYWRRLLLARRAHVSPVEIRYAHLPPRAFLHDTMRVVIESMRIAGAPESDVRSLRGLAEASDAQLLPQPRYVLLAGIAAGDIPERPRYEELVKRAPLRYSERRVVERRPVERPAAPEPVAASVAPLARPLRAIGAWFAPAEPRPAAARPAVRAAAQAHPVATPLAAVPFGLPEEPHVGFGFAAEETPETDAFASRFGVPQMPGSDALEWGEGAGFTS